MPHQILSSSAAILAHQQAVNQLNGLLAVVQDAVLDHLVELIHRDRHPWRSRSVSQLVSRVVDITQPLTAKLQLARIHAPS